MLVCSMLSAATFAGEVSGDSVLTAFAQHRTNAVRITSVPIRMADQVSILCAPPPLAFQRITESQRTNAAFPSDPHLTNYVHVYVSPGGDTAMRTKPAAFPVGTIILKEKFSDSQGQYTELFTGMLKRDAGYNPDCGNWEFFTLSADASRVTSRGKLENCMACHVDYRDSDFVTKSYYY